MGIWVVILEAVATEGEMGGLGIEPGALTDLADELAANYAVVTERPGAYETELWVEEGTAGGAVLAAQRLSQAAVRFLGLPAWEVVRAEVRDAHALEIGAIDWPDPPVTDEPPELDAGPITLEAVTAPPPTAGAPAKKAAARKTAARKTAAKAETKKSAAKRIVTKKTVVTTAPATKAVARKTVARKTVARKTVVTTAPATRAVAKKAVARKTVVSETVVTKAAGRRTSAKKAGR